MGIFMLNGINYMGGGGQSFQPVIYSTEEREIGVWTDGKPLYQKTLVLEQSFSTNTWYLIDFGTGNELKTVVYAAFIHTNGTTFTIPYFRSANEYATGDISGSLFEGLFKGLTTIVKMIATVQYTKTADAAGSGTWTPQGVPAVHYDDTEKVVGTWFGETLYEKTLLYQKANISSGSQNINHGITSFGKLVSLDAVWVYSNGDCNFATAVNVGDANYLMKIWDFGTSDFTLHIGSSAYSIFDYVAFTIRYTKTTS